MQDAPQRPLVGDAPVISPINCITGELGSILVNVSGGTPPLNYSWSHDPFLFGPLAENLNFGNYGVTVTDALQCPYYILIEFVESIGQIEEMVDAFICHGDSIYLAGSWQTEEGDYEDYYMTSNDCDSIVTTSLFVSLIPE